jgi:hypothetical protein
MIRQRNWHTKTYLVILVGNSDALINHVHNKSLIIKYNIFPFSLHNRF